MPVLFSVIIPFRNAEQTLSRCLEGLNDQTWRGAENILVNNGSTDNSAAIAREFRARRPNLNLRLIEERKPGAAAARNAGAREAQAPWLVFTDADCVPAPDWLADLARETEAPAEIGALAGCVRTAPAQGTIGRFLGLYTLPANPKDEIVSAIELGGRGGFPTANLAVRKSLFDQLGGFNETLRLYGEDTDLCRRIYESGCAIKALTNAVIHHIHRESFAAMTRQARGFGRAHAWALRQTPIGTLVAQAPGLHWRGKAPAPVRCWLDLNPADKKMALTLLPALLWPPLWALPAVYFCYLALTTARRMRARGQALKLADPLLMPALLLAKSAAMTWGRWSGSVENKVFCL